MRELSAFVDEFGNLGDDAKYYLLALVLHDQSKDVFECIGRYGAWLRVPRRLRVRAEQAGDRLQGLQPRGLPAPADSGLHLRGRVGRDQVRGERGRRNREAILRHQPRLQEKLLEEAPQEALEVANGAEHRPAPTLASGPRSWRCLNSPNPRQLIGLSILEVAQGTSPIRRDSP